VLVLWQVYKCRFIYYSHSLKGYSASLPLVGSRDLRQMSEYPIPNGKHYDSCVLRRSCKSAFLHPEEEIQGLIDLPQG
jgi:hypothetical protein